MLMKLTRTIAASVLLLVGTVAAQASDIDNFVENGAAIGGTDPVAYFTEGRPVAGSDAFTAEYDGVTWKFASAANRDAFLADPAKYAPAYGGFCATGTRFSKKVPVKPEFWKIVDGRLYLNSSEGSHNRFLKEEAETISTADDNWPKIKDIPADQL